MDILTLLRANIKRKKGTFLGIVLLMIIVSMFLTTIYSVKKNVRKSVDDAYEEANAANLMMNITNERLSDELLQKVKDHPLVDHVATSDAVLMRRHFVKDKEDNQSWLIVPLNDVVTKFREVLLKIRHGFAVNLDYLEWSVLLQYVLREHTHTRTYLKDRDVGTCIHCVGYVAGHL